MSKVYNQQYPYNGFRLASSSAKHRKIIKHPYSKKEVYGVRDNNLSQADYTQTATKLLKEKKQEF